MLSFLSRRPRGAIVLVLLFVTAVLLAGCGGQVAETPATRVPVPEGVTEPYAVDTEASAPERVRSEKLKILTTIRPAYDFTAKIAGDDAEVSVIIPAGVAAHGWEPGPKDMVALSGADVLISIGAGMDTWSDTLAATCDEDLIRLELARLVTLLPGDEEHDHDGHGHGEADGHDEHDHDEHAGHSHGAFDPHIWLDPQRGIELARGIADLLGHVDPARRDGYEGRAAELIERLEELDARYHRALAPHAGRVILLSHAAFGYLCDAYGLRQIALEGVFSESEPSPARMAELVRLAAEESITSVYVEPLASPRSAEALATEIGGRTLVLDPYEGVTTEQEAKGEDYFTVMERNLEALLAGFKAD